MSLPVSSPLHPQALRDYVSTRDFVTCFRSKQSYPIELLFADVKRHPATIEMQLPWPFNSGNRAGTADSANVVATAQTSTHGDNRASITPTKRTLTQEEQADVEFAELVKEFASSNAPDVQPRTGVVEQTPQAQKPPRPRRVYEAQTYEDGTIDIRPEVMHPRSMNCRQQFDQAFYCQSLGGKFNDIYRHGHFQSCSEQWGAFWFCMRTRTLDDDAKAAETTAYYADRDEKRKKEHGSSEDIWEIRTRSVQRAFWKNPDEVLKDVNVKD